MTNSSSTFYPYARDLAFPLNYSLLPKRKKDCHKNDFGQVLIIGGNKGMSGSVFLAAQAALRVGAGVVTIATHPDNHFSSLPEIMVHPIEHKQQLDTLLAQADVCVIGPGLGMDEWAESLFLHAMAAALPFIIDASALRFLAKTTILRVSQILTPHPGEAAELLACSTTKIQRDRVAAAALMQKKYGGVAVLKGAGTLVHTGKDVYVCNAGNPGMATAGMGDVLSGVIAGLAAQKLSLENAALLGVWLHAHAGDRAALKGGERGLIASDLMPELRSLVNLE